MTIGSSQTLPYMAHQNIKKTVARRGNEPCVESLYLELSKSIFVPIMHPGYHSPSRYPDIHCSTDFPSSLLSTTKYFGISTSQKVHVVEVYFMLLFCGKHSCKYKAI